MRVKDKGPIPWLAWAYFDCRGAIKRMPYAVAYVILVFLVNIFGSMIPPAVAVYIFPPPAGTEVNAAWLEQLVASGKVLPFMLPFFYIYVVLDLKRLRSIGTPLLVSLGCPVLFAALSLAAPLVLPKLVQECAMAVFAYHAILFVVPAREDRVSPLERKYMVWQALATGDGTPRRLTRKEIKGWRIVRQGPAKAE
jgi:hypothetical protein